MSGPGFEIDIQPLLDAINAYLPFAFPVMVVAGGIIIARFVFSFVLKSFISSRGDDIAPSSPIVVYQEGTPDLFDPDGFFTESARQKAERLEYEHYNPGVGTVLDYLDSGRYTRAEKRYLRELFRPSNIGYLHPSVYRNPDEYIEARRYQDRETRKERRQRQKYGKRGKNEKLF